MHNILTDMRIFRYISILVLAASAAISAHADKTNFRWIKDIDYSTVRHFSQGHSAFQQNGKWGFINTAGEVVVEAQYEDCHDYMNGYAAVKINGVWGFIDTYHNLIITPEYDEVEDFKNGLAIVTRNGKLGVINTKGECPAGFIFDNIEEYKDGFALANVDGIQYFLDSDGEIIKLHKNYDFYSFSNGLAPVRHKKKDKWGYIDKRGRLVIETKYDTVHKFSNNIALVKHRGLHKYIKRSGGEQYIEGISGQPLEFVNGFAKISNYNGSTYSFITSDFKRLSGTFKEASDFSSHNMAAVRLTDNTLCYINAAGKEKFKSDYDMIGDFSANGLALVKKNGKFGYINTDGKLVIDTLFTDATDFRSGHAYVATENRFGFIEYKPNYKMPAILVSDLKMTDDGDNLICQDEPFTITASVRNPSNEEMKNVKVTLDNQRAHEAWFTIANNEIIISSIGPRTDSTVVFQCSSNRSIESGEISMRISAVPSNMLCQDAEEVTFQSRGIAASKPVLKSYLVYRANYERLSAGEIIDLKLTVKNEGKDPAQDIRLKFIWPEGCEGEDEEVTIKTLEAGASTDVLTRFATSFLMPEETIVVEISDATGKNDTFRYVTYQEGKMNAMWDFEGDNSSYNPYSMTMNMGAMYGGGYYNPNGTADMGIRMENSSQSGLGQKKEVSELLKDIVKVAEPNSNKYALIFGNEDYNLDRRGIVESPNVEFAKADAEAFMKYAINYMGVPAENCIIYPDATFNRMRQGIDKLAKLCETSSGEAEIYVFYAGHGQPEEGTKNTYLIPCDGNLKDPTSGYKLDDFYSAISDMPAKKKMIFLDACYSGQGRAAWATIVYEAAALRGNVIVMTATSGEEKSMPYKEKKQGTFTYHLLNAIKETKGEADIKTLFDMVAKRVGQTSILINDSKQTPQLITGEGIQEGWEAWKIY